MKVKINAKKIIYLHLYIDIFVNLIKNIIPQLAFLAFLPDMLNFVLLFWMFGSKKRIKNSAKYLLIFIGTLLIYDIVLALWTKPNILLFIWGLRNQYRFLLFSLFVVVFIDRSDLPNIKRILCNCFNINMLIVPIEFILGYKRDYLGGTFGIENNCNGVTNIFLVIIVCYAIMSWFYKEITIKRLIYLIGGSLFWAALAEIKVFFVEIVLIAFISFLLVKGKKYKKIEFIALGLIAMVISIGLLCVVFPDQMNFIIQYGLVGYAKGVNIGSYGYGRTTAIPLTNSLLFNNDIYKIFFGIGTGNAEFMSIGSFKLNSSFYEVYGDFAYATMFYSFIYVERGIIGIIIYLKLFIDSIRKSIKFRREKENVVINKMLITCISIFVFISIYDASFRVSTGGYFAFMIIALTYVVNDKSKI